MTKIRNASAEKRNAAMEAIKGSVPAASVSATGSELPVSAAVAPATAPELVSPTKASRDVAKVMLYLSPRVARKFKEIAFHEERKAHDIYLDALDLYLTQHGYGGLKGVIDR